MKCDYDMSINEHEHFVCAHTSVSVHLSLLFTSMLTHGHMPAGLMKTAIVPILKNRQGDTSDNP